MRSRMRPAVLALGCDGSVSDERPVCTSKQAAGNDHRRHRATCKDRRRSYAWGDDLQMLMRSQRTRNGLHGCADIEKDRGAVGYESCDRATDAVLGGS